MRCANSPASERTACQDGMVVKARNHSRVASALPHSEGIAYKPPCGEVAMCPRVGRMGPVKRGRTGTAEPGPERGPLGRRATHPPRRCIIMVSGPAQYGATAPTLRCTKGDGKPAVSRRMPGAGLSLWRSGKAPPDRPAFQPYWGKPAVRNERGDRGNVGIIRSPVRASILPDSVAQQKGLQMLALRAQVRHRGLTGPHQLAHGLMPRVGDPDPGEFASAMQPGQGDGIPAIGLDALARPLRDQ